MTKTLVIAMLLMVIAGCDSAPKESPQRTAENDMWARLDFNLRITMHINLSSAETSMCTIDILDGIAQRKSQHCLNSCAMTDTINREIDNAPSGINRKKLYLKVNEFCLREEKNLLKKGIFLPIWTDADFDALLHKESSHIPKGTR